MPFTVADVIRDAQDLHPRFDEHAGLPGPLLRLLSRERDRIVQDTVNLFPDPLLLETEEVVFGDRARELEEGHKLPAHYFARGAWALATNGAHKDRFRLIPWNNMTGTEVPFPSGAIKGGRLFLVGSASHWGGYRAVTVDYVPHPPALRDGESRFTPLPDYAKNTLVAAAGVWMANRLPDVDPRPFRADHKEERERYLTTVTSQRRAAPRRIQSA